ncbi:MAG TPA: ROK family protein [Opitutaceae bacterium]
MSAREHVLGLDLGGTRVKALALTPGGEVIARETAPSEGSDWQERVKGVVAALSERLGPPLVIGVAAPGLAASDERSIASMPGRLPGLEGLDWSAWLEAPRGVPVLNDAHAALLGEVWQGAARGERDVLLLTLGTGLGGAAMVDGRLLRGRVGRAGHFGHITLDAAGAPDIVNTPGSLEDAVGNHSLPRRSGNRYTDTATLVRDAGRGEPLAAAIWSRTVRDLAAGMVSLINAFDPAVILVGGGIAEAGDALLRPLAGELDRLEWRPAGHRVRIAKAGLGDLAGAFGAARRALDLHGFHIP